MEVLTMRNVRKSFEGTEVLKDISFSVQKGEVVALIGPSGSGKSTLLRCATLLETMDGGELIYRDAENGAVTDYVVCKNDENGNSVYSSPAVLRDVRRQYGLVFQNFNLFPHYTVLKNITDAPISVQKIDKAEAEKTAYALLEKMGLSDKANAYPGFLSGGQQQRVSIARALALNPEVLFFDEPTSALDPELTVEILKVIKELAAEDTTMVIVTHEIEFARKVADRVIFMADGVIVEEGAPDDVILNSKNERTRAFLGQLQNR
ncbi:MAG: amino acid ABC transporter ATP-binding protein [Clostridiales bacterium]|nr:amino acid ABC transporter ATP-binding protein [Clostridiales bacterium]